MFTANQFSPEELARIFAAGAGQTIYFSRPTAAGPRSARAARDREILTEYAQGKPASAIPQVSEQRVYQILRAERARYSVERVLWWRERGLSWRELGRLYGRAHTTVREFVGGQED